MFLSHLGGGGVLVVSHGQAGRQEGLAPDAEESPAPDVERGQPGR